MSERYTYVVKKGEEVVRKIILSDKQKRCLVSKAKEILASGGFRAGKSLGVIIKIIAQHLTVPNNRGLIGRLTYPELRDTVQKDFFQILPSEWIKTWRESRGELILKNGTEILFRHLDSVSEEEMRGMTLGFAYISQVEEIKESVYLTLKSRINLQHVPARQLLMDCNPVLFWAYKYFKQENDPDRELIEFSMFDNKDNLPEDYLADMMKRPENWKKQYVYGVWDESLLSDKAVIPVEYIQLQKRFVRKPKRMLDDVQIFEDVIPEHTYQAGVDTSEGLGLDYSSLSIFDCQTGEQVAYWRGQVQPDLLAMKIVPALRYFNDAFVVPEINGCGLAFVNKLKEIYENIYKRKEFDRDNEVEKEMLGWKTSFVTKPLLVSNFIKLLREGHIKLRSEETVNEMPTFVYSDEGPRKGMGAQGGFHDDSLIGAMLGCWNILENQVRMGVSLSSFDHLVGGGRGGW